jgi:ParB/RepB/Spo0J family partition protein
MSTLRIDPTKCKHNKFQPLSRRTFTPADLADLESIQTRGLDYPIIIHMDPARPDSYIVMDGWRRTSAWLLWRPGEPIPAEIRPGVPTDRELFETCVITNEGRANLNAIQKSDLLSQGINLGMTQVQAGKLFNPPIQQSAVSHLLSLRKLPDEIKMRVESGDIPERIARLLVTPAKHMQLEAIKAAVAIAKAKPEDRDNIARQAIHRLYFDGGKFLDFLHITPWKLDWPAAPLDAPDARGDKGEPTSIPACTDCPFNVEWNRNKYCMRPACHGAKTRLWNAQQKEKQPAGVPVTSKRQPSDWERKEKERRKLLAADNKQSRILVAAATPAIATSLPAHPVVLDLLFKALQFHMDISSHEADKKWKATPSSVRREMIAKVLLTEHVGLDPWKRTTPAHAKQSIEKLAVALKVNLPPHWSDPPAPARSARAAKKGRKA